MAARKSSRRLHWFSPLAAAYAGFGIILICTGSWGWGALNLLAALCILLIEGRLRA